jgi:hypothetical protein
MHIGIDFDNTIVCYDNLFHKVAVEKNLIPENLAKSKLAVRDYLRAAGIEERWTAMQGEVYGGRICEAVAYDGAIDFIEQMAEIGHSISIISHKTRHPLSGSDYDLHAAAQSWIDTYLVPRLTKKALSISAHFELTKDEKLGRIKQCACSVFIDDLPEILLAEKFPSATQRLLFDPEGRHLEIPGGLDRFSSWTELARHFGQP